ncbi:MAG: amino acid deaminase [Microbacterium sp.]|uniref:amino acid deaminase n=1 Tax=Microbacterium sp. TaxID=51671 RepID=UPI003BAE25E5
MSTLDLLTAAAALAADGTPGGAAAALDALPWLDAAIESDRAAHRFEEWGLSTTIDENTHSPVISQALFEELHRRAGLPASWPVGNAGLLHCYGYLLSLEPTPYGLKRVRWLSGELARGLGLPEHSFSPWDADATLLSRATAAASALLTSSTVTRSAQAEGRVTCVALRTDAGPTALVYAVAPTPTDGPLLVTMFPVSDAARALSDFDAANHLRWNAV